MLLIPSSFFLFPRICFHPYTPITYLDRQNVGEILDHNDRHKD